MDSNGHSRQSLEIKHFSIEKWAPEKYNNLSVKPRLPYGTVNVDVTSPCL